MKKKIYISGRITGYEKEAEKQFNEAEKEFIARGFEVVNPMKLKHNHDKTWEEYMREDIKALMTCDCILMLKRWEFSKGALIEFNLATKLNFKIYVEE